jgi:hypothetical protein
METPIFSFKIAGLLFLIAGISHLVILTNDRTLTWIVAGLMFVVIALYFYFTGNRIELERRKK